MDPILIKAIRELRAQLKRVPDATREEKEGFLREKTGGKYGFADYIKHIAGNIDSDVTPANVGRSLSQGALMDFADELTGAVQGEGAKQEMRLKDEMFHDAHPKTDMLGRFSGAMASGLLVPGSGGATVGSAMARGALVGGGAGALTALGSGEDRSAYDAAADMAKGGGLGALAGAVLPAIVGTAKLSASTGARAGRRLEHAVEESGGPGALSEELGRHVAAGRGDDVMFGDLSDRLRAEADFAANASDDVMVQLAQKVKARQADMSDRLLQDAKHSFGDDPNAAARLESMRDARIKWANSDEGFAGLRAKGKNLGGLEHGDEGLVALSPADENLAGILKQPKIRDAWRDAHKAGLIGAEPDVGMPSFEKLQNVKFDLDDAVGQAYRQGRVNLATRLKDARAALVQELEDRVPGYKAANAKYERMLRSEQALQDGVDAWGVNDSAQLAQQVKKLAPSELEQFRYGMASSLLNQLRNAQTNRNVAEMLMNQSKTLEQKLRVVFGSKESFDSFMSRVSSEADLAKMKGPLNNSATVRRLTAQGFDPAELGISAASGGPGAALLSAAALLGKGALARGTARQTGPMLMLEGAPNIEQLLQQWGSRAPLVGRTYTGGLPAGATSLFDLYNR